MPVCMPPGPIDIEDCRDMGGFPFPPMGLTRRGPPKPLFGWEWLLDKTWWNPLGMP